MEFIEEIRAELPNTPAEGFRQITDEELRDWTRIYNTFRSQAYDTCRTLLAKYRYKLTQLTDAKTGDVYDVLTESAPIRLGWGTFIYNRQHAKRLFVDVNHPVDDPNVLGIGADLFRRTEAEWLLIAGAGRRASVDNFSSDVARVRKSLFQRWHELITDLTHVTLSLHGYNRDSYHEPISQTDVVVSNGRTSDVQWGISEISLALRDTLRSNGILTALAMFDSGYASLAGSGNPQATFSNDSMGFGHWMNVELSRAIRTNPRAYRLFIASVNRAMELTGRKISQQMNRAFGLVSPRIVRLDSMRHMEFPPLIAETYRIISFNPTTRTSDTIDVRMGNWFGFGGAANAITTITKIDPSEGSFGQRMKQAESGSTLSIGPNQPLRDALAKSLSSRKRSFDSTSFEDPDWNTTEPLQVHRIPLQPYLVSNLTNGGRTRIPIFQWQGLIGHASLPVTSMFSMDNGQSLQGDEESPSYLVPIIHNTFGSNEGKFIGVQMTSVLVKEIARLVTERRENEKDIRLLAEQSGGGGYYLRIFPSNSTTQLALFK